jgi:hypothetical protein
MEQETLLKDLEIKFNNLKKDQKIKASLEELDEIFFIKDYICKEGFVSDRLGRQICHRIVETYMGWNEFLHGLIMPDPHNLLNIGESKIFDQEYKKKIFELMKKIMENSSSSNLILLKRSRKDEGKFIDKALNEWKEIFLPEIINIMEKINNEWKMKEHTKDLR